MMASAASATVLVPVASGMGGVSLAVGGTAGIGSSVGIGGGPLTALDVSTQLFNSAKALQNGVAKRVQELERLHEKFIGAVANTARLMPAVSAASQALAGKQSALHTFRLGVEHTQLKVNGDIDKVFDRLRERVIDRGLWRARQREREPPTGAATAAPAAATSEAASPRQPTSSSSGKRLLYDYVDRAAVDRLRGEVKREVDACALAVNAAADWVRELNAKFEHSTAQLHAWAELPLPVAASAATSPMANTPPSATATTITASSTTSSASSSSTSTSSSPSAPPDGAASATTPSPISAGTTPDSKPSPLPLPLAPASSTAISGAPLTAAALSTLVSTKVEQRLVSARAVIDMVERDVDDMSLLYVRLMALHETQNKRNAAAAAAAAAFHLPPTATATAVGGKPKPAPLSAVTPTPPLGGELDRDLVVVQAPLTPVRQRSRESGSVTPIIGTQPHAPQPHPPAHLFSSFLNATPPHSANRRTAATGVGGVPAHALAAANAAANALTIAVTAMDSPARPHSHSTASNAGGALLADPFQLSQSPRSLSPALPTLSPSPPPFVMPASPTRAGGGGGGGGGGGVSRPAMIGGVSSQESPMHSQEHSTVNSALFADNEKQNDALYGPSPVIKPSRALSAAATGTALKVVGSAGNPAPTAARSFERDVEQVLQQLRAAYAVLQTHVSGLDAQFNSYQALVTAASTLARELELSLGAASEQSAALDTGLVAARERNTSHTAPILVELKNLAAFYNLCASGYDAMLPEIVRRHTYAAQLQATIAAQQQQLLELERAEHQRRKEFHHSFGRYLPPTLCPALQSEGIPHVRITPESVMPVALPQLSAEYLASVAAAANNGQSLPRRRDSVQLSASSYGAGTPLLQPATAAGLFGAASVTQTSMHLPPAASGSGTSPTLTSVATGTAAAPGTASVAATATTAPLGPTTPPSHNRPRRSPSTGSDGGSPLIAAVVAAAPPSSSPPSALAMGLAAAAATGAVPGASPPAPVRVASFAYSPNATTTTTTAANVPFHSPVLHPTAPVQPGHPANNAAVGGSSGSGYVPSHPATSPVPIAVPSGSISSAGGGGGGGGGKRRSISGSFGSAAVAGASPPAALFLASPLLRPHSLSNQHSKPSSLSLGSQLTTTAAAPATTQPQLSHAQQSAAPTALSPLSFAPITPSAAPPTISLLHAKLHPNSAAPSATAPLPQAQPSRIPTITLTENHF